MNAAMLIYLISVILILPIGWFIWRYEVEVERMWQIRYEQRKGLYEELDKLIAEITEQEDRG